VEEGDAASRFSGMARITVLALLVLVAVVPAASAATSIRWVTMDSPRSPWGQYNREVVVRTDNAANNDIVVQPSYQDSRQPYPHVVDVYDYGDTIVDGTTGALGEGSCRLYSSHHAACLSTGLTNYPEIAVSTGDGDDKVTFNDYDNPMIFSASMGNGNDNLSVDGAYPCLAFLGAGDDRAHLGTALSHSVSLCPTREWNVYGDDGTDIIDTVNGLQDVVDCGLGTDILAFEPVLDTTAGCEPLP
jgi:hypothetical protein